MKKELQSKDLRIGNLVMTKESKFPNIQMCEVVAIASDSLGLRIIPELSDHATRLLTVKINEVVGIPITVDGLFMFNFKEIKALETDEYVFSSFHRIGFFIEHPFYSFEHNDRSLEIATLHELQNLYFAIEEKELIRLPNLKP